MSDRMSDRMSLTARTHPCAQSFMLLLGCRVLETRLMQRLRFKAGGIYTVQVGGAGVGRDCSVLHAACCCCCCRLLSGL
jgi:hypothetical protein